MYGSELFQKIGFFLKDLNYEEANFNGRINFLSSWSTMEQNTSEVEPSSQEFKQVGWPIRFAIVTAFCTSGGVCVSFIHHQKYSIDLSVE